MSKGAPLFSREVELAVSSSDSVCLLIDQKSVGDVGAVVWDSALVAVRYFEKLFLNNSAVFAGRRVIELGAGTGVCSAALALYGADVTSTDLPEQMDLIQLNMQKHKNLFSGRATAQTLDWTHPLADSLKQQHYDIVLIVDCVYYEASIQPLVDTLLSLTDADVSDTEIWCVFERRDIGKPAMVQPLFLEIMEQHFDCSTVRLAELDDCYASSDIPFMKFRRKSIR